MKEFSPVIEQMNPAQLTPYSNNTKLHTIEQIDKIAGQIAKFGFDQPIVVDKSGVIIKGHGRREAALRLKMKTVPVIVTTLSEYEAMAARIADNVIAAETKLDHEMVKFELGTLKRVDFDLKATGFELTDIDDLLSEGDVVSEKSKQKSAQPEPPGDPDDEEEDDEGEPLKTQFIVTVHCTDESQMKTVYEELKGRGLSCKLIT